MFCSIHRKASYSVTLNDTMFKCPAFGKGVCPYTILVTKRKSVAGDCPALKDGCPFKNCESVGEFVKKLTHMRDQMKDSAKGKEATATFFKELRAVTTTIRRRSWVNVLSKLMSALSAMMLMETLSVTLSNMADQERWINMALTKAS